MGWWVFGIVAGLSEKMAIARLWMRQRQPDAHLSRAAIGPDGVGDEAEFDRLRFGGLQLAVELVAPVCVGAGEGLAFEHGDPAEQALIVAGAKFVGR